jgi:protein TonB
MIPITRQEEKPPPPPPPPPEIIEIVEDEVEIENELEIEETDTDENEFIEQEEEEDSDEVFMVVEQMPVFPGGDLGLMKFIQKNTKYPPIAKENDITGKVYVSYVVNKKGKVTNVKVARSVDRYLDAEAVRVVKLLPYSSAGKQRGKPVNVQYTIPINFTLN